MSDGMKEIAEWQRRFYEGDPVWAVLCDEGVGNYYTTKEAAQMEVDYLKSRGITRRVRAIHLHTPELSCERWVHKFKETP